jgi:hypothetical protein
VAADIPAKLVQYMTEALQEQHNPAAIPLSVRIIANLEIFVKVPMVVFGLLLAARHRSPAILLGFLIPHPVALPILASLTAGSVTLAVATLRRKPWGLDGLLAYSVFGVINTPVILLSRARLTYETIQAHRLVVESHVSAETAMSTQQVIFSSVCVIAFTISAIYLYLLLTRRRAFRLACTARADS